MSEFSKPLTSEQLIASREVEMKAASTAYQEATKQLLDALTCIRPRFRSESEIQFGIGSIVRSAVTAEEAALLEAEDFQTTLPRNLVESGRYVELFGIYPTGASGL